MKKWKRVKNQKKEKVVQEEDEEHEEQEIGVKIDFFFFVTCKDDYSNQMLYMRQSDCGQVPLLRRASRRGKESTRSRW